MVLARSKVFAGAGLRAQSLQLWTGKKGTAVARSLEAPHPILFMFCAETTTRTTDSRACADPPPAERHHATPYPRISSRMFAAILCLVIIACGRHTHTKTQSMEPPSNKKIQPSTTSIPRICMCLHIHVCVNTYTKTNEYIYILVCMYVCT